MELFKLLGTIAVDNQEANHAIDETTDRAEQSHSRINGAFDKIGGAAVKVGKVIGAGLAAGATAIGALVKQSVGSYSEYEQLVGGVETLFQESSGRVMLYAQHAYRSAGMSANEYMETVTSFSASLLQGLGGDTERAAEIANRAITDMSDNANKMGTDMSMIQNAYQGFAKQNYTMLDNLKLGYGGTQAEMARLINDSGVLGDSFKVTAETVNQVSFDKIIEAIGVVQDEMGITGTTAREASSTIQGSLAATKSAWQNLLTGFADGNQDLSVLISHLIDSAKTAAANIIPVVQEALGGITELLVQVVPLIVAEFPAMVEEILPGLIEAAVALLTGLIAVLPDILRILLEQMPFIVQQISLALIEAFPVLLQTVKDLFGQIWDYISLELLNTGVSFEDAFAKIKLVFEGAWTVLQELWNTIGQPIWDMIQRCVETVKGIFEEKMPEIQGFVSSCFEDIKIFWENNLKPCFDAIGDFIETVLAPVFEAVFSERIKGTIDTVFSYVQSIWDNTLKPVFTGITDFLTGVFTLNWEQAWDGIVNIFKGIINIIPTTLEKVINGAIDMINGLIAGVSAIAGLLGLGEIKPIPKVTLPKLEEGGVLEKGQIGLLEGTGAEAVVPLDQNKKWISAVAADIQKEFGGIDGGAEQVQEFKLAFAEFVDALPEMLTDAFASMKFDVNNREFARLVKAVN